MGFIIMARRRPGGVYELRDIKSKYNSAVSFSVLILFICQGMTFGFVPFVNWTTFFCPEEAYTDDGRGPVMYDLCPSISTTISTMGIPIYLWILSSCLMTISLLFALTNWTVIILAIAKNKTYCPSLFLRDGVYNKTIGTICWFYSLIGLVIICLLLLLRLTLDKSQVGTFDLGWFVIFTPCNIACWELLSLKVTIMCVSYQYRRWHRYQVRERGGITEKSSLLMNS